MKLSDAASSGRLLSREVNLTKNDIVTHDNSMTREGEDISALSAHKGGKGTVSERRTSVDHGGIGASARMFSWDPSRIAAMLTEMQLPHLARTAETKGIRGEDLLQVRQPVGTDEAVGIFLGTTDAKEQRDIVAKMKEIRANELASAPKVPSHVMAKVEQSKKTSSLNLNNSKISRLPDIACEIVSLTNLSVCCNNLRSLMPEVGFLTKLLSLKCTSNKLISIPESIGYLQNLQTLLLDDNELRSLPQTMVKCTSLKVLDVSQNKLAMLPTGLFMCTRLSKLNVYDNPLMIPNEVIKRGAPALLKILRALHLANQSGFLDLSKMQLLSVPPVVLTLTTVTDMCLDDNAISHLNGLHVQTRLRSLSAVRNCIGSLPLSLKSLTNLTLLNLSSNPIVSPPAAILELPAPMVVSYLLRRSMLVGETIDGMFSSFDKDGSGNITRAEFSDGLHLIELAHRRVEVDSILESTDQDGNGLISLQEFREMMLTLLKLGALQPQPLDLAGLGMQTFTLDFVHPGYIAWLSLAHNKLRDLPEDMCHLQNLETLIVDCNQLMHVPPSCKLSSLTVLSMRENKIVALPDWMASMTRLCKLLVDSNQLSGVPCEIGAMFNLQELSLDGNPLQMPLRRLLREGASYVRAYLALFVQAQQTGLLDLSSMGLHTLPMEARLSNINTCLLAHNKLEQSPAGLASGSQLQYLDLSNNGMERLDGSVMAAFANLTTLILAGNRLQGVSRRVSLMYNLRKLDLSHNRIMELPTTLSALTSLQVLDLSNNGLEALPPTVAGLVSLTDLIIQHNELAGLPGEIGRMTGLRTLMCRANNIARLPDCFATMNLHVMDVSHNPLSSLPYSLGALVTCLHDIRLDRHLHLEDPPDVIIARGTKALLTYLERQLLATYTKCLDLSSLQLAVITAPLNKLEHICSGLLVLNVADNLVHEMPRSIGGDLAYLETLVLRNNRITKLPPSAKQIKTLTHLDIAGNLFERVPEMLAHTPLIRFLDMDRNRLDSLYRTVDSVAGGGFNDALSMSKRQRDKKEADDARGLRGLVQLKVMDRVASRLQSHNRSKQVGALFQLLHLHELYVSDNAVRVLPGSISRFTALTVLDMHSNQLGDLPPDIGECTRLTHVDVSHNNLLGLPPDIGKLVKVTYLNISNNAIARLPPDIGNMTSLTELNLDKNKLVFIPVEIEGLETSLTLLHAAGNVLRDPPSEILEQGRDALFTYLRRVRNGRKSRDLVLIDMRLAHVNFNYESLTGLTALELSGNMISQLPKEVLLLTNLTVLKAPGNRLERVVENDYLGALSNLTYLHLKDNQLPNLDSSLGTLQLLREIDLEGNRVVDIVSEIMQCVKIKRLNVSENMLETLPKHIFRIPEISHIKADHNVLLSLPSALCLAVHVKELDLCFNRLQHLPRDIGNLYNLVYLNVDNNLLQHIPSSIRYCSSLQQLYVNDNKLCQLPEELGRLKELKELHVRNNNLVLIPPEIKGLASLTLLSVEGNPFLPLPSTIRGVTSLQFLGTNAQQLAALQIEGDKPPPATVIFEASETNVTMRKLPRHLVLDGVHRMGSYLDRMNRADNSMTMDLTHMDLTFVPQEVLSLSALTALDCKENRITAIPVAIVTLSLLTHLDMSSNQVVEVPQELGCLTHLVTLSLARNHISLLPASLQRLALLKVFNVHVNELSSLLPVHRKLLKSKSADMLLLGANTLAPGLEHGGTAAGKGDTSSDDSDAEGAEKVPKRFAAMLSAPGFHLGVIGIAGIQDLECSYNNLSRLPDLTAMRSIRRINVSHNVLRSLPEEICELHTLEKIESGDNRVRIIPSSVSRLTRLTLLSLKNNNLRVLPPQLGDCAKLKYLSLYANDLVSLPDELCSLKNLVRLSVQANNIVTLPWFLGELASLKILDLAANPIKSIPPSVGALDNVLETLELLNCMELVDPPPMITAQGHKQIMTYLRKVWRGFTTRRMVLIALNMGRISFDLTHAGLQGLVEFRVDKNHLQVLPLSVGLLTNLRSLRLRDNLVESLPHTLSCLTCLQELDVSKNRLRILPRTIVCLTRLERLRCGNNPIPYPLTNDWIEDKVQKFLQSYVRDTIGKRVSAMWSNNNISEIFSAWGQYVADVRGGEPLEDEGDAE